jgi:microcystin-dependent protein
MSSPYLGEIRMFGGNFAPAGWALCNGQLIAISQNDALFALIGTTYGGDGESTFALPNLQSRVPVHVGPGFALGQLAGTETVTLTTNQIPQHNHPSMAVGNAATAVKTPGGNMLTDEVSASPPTPMVFAYGAPDGNMRSLAPNALGISGGSQPHDNMLPFLCVNFIIALEGIFPTQT